MLERFFGGLAILVIGFDLIWLGCKSNGADNFRNPVWGFLDGFITFQEYILGFIATIGLANAGWYLWNEFASPKASKLDTPHRSYQETSRYTPVPAKREYQVTTPTPKVPEPEYFQPPVSSFRSTPVKEVVPIVPKPVPQKPKLTAKELKEKAIQELLGRY